MSTLTVELPEEDLQFLKTWTQTKGMSVEAWVAHQARHLRESASRPLHPEVQSLIGILPAELDPKAEYAGYLEEKYCG